MTSSALDLFEVLFSSNKYVINISNTVNKDWTIYMYKDKYIKLDLQTSDALTSREIDVKNMIDYIETEDDIKIKFTCYYDDFTSYNKLMICILNKIQRYYFEHNKNIIIKYKSYY